MWKIFSRCISICLQMTKNRLAYKAPNCCWNSFQIAMHGLLQMSSLVTNMSSFIRANTKTPEQDLGYKVWQETMYCKEDRQCKESNVYHFLCYQLRVPPWRLHCLKANLLMLNFTRQKFFENLRSTSENEDQKQVWPMSDCCTTTRHHTRRLYEGW